MTSSPLMSVHRLEEVLELAPEAREDLLARIEAKARAGTLEVTGLRRIADGWVREPVPDWSSYVFDWAGEKPPSGYKNAPCARRRRLPAGPISFETWRAKGESRLEEQLRLARAQELPNAAWRQPAPGVLTMDPALIAARYADDPVVEWTLNEWCACSSQREQPADASLCDEPEFEPGDIYFDLAVTEKAWAQLSNAPARAQARSVVPDSIFTKWYKDEYLPNLPTGVRPSVIRDIKAARDKFGDRARDAQTRRLRAKNPVGRPPTKCVK